MSTLANNTGYGARFPAGSSVLEARLLELIDSKGGKVAMDDIDKLYKEYGEKIAIDNNMYHDGLGGAIMDHHQTPWNLHKDLNRMKQKSVKAAINANKLPNISRVQLNILGKKKTTLKWCIIRRAQQQQQQNQQQYQQQQPQQQHGANVSEPLPASASTTSSSANIILTDTIVQLDILKEASLFAKRWNVNDGSGGLNYTTTESSTQGEYSDDPNGSELDHATTTQAVVVAIDYIGTPDQIYMIHVATLSNNSEDGGVGMIYIFDCIKLGEMLVCGFLAPLLADTNVYKIVHDGHAFAAALYTLGGIESIQGVLDTQLVVEVMEPGHYLTDFTGMVKHLNKMNLSSSTNNTTMQQFSNENLDVYQRRPLSREVLQNSTRHVQVLISLADSILSELRVLNLLSIVQRASDSRMQRAGETDGQRQICFDVPNGYSIASLELLQLLRPQDVFETTPLIVSDETETLTSLLPSDLAEILVDQTEHLSDIVLDRGRTPHAWINGERVLLGNEEGDRIVEESEIDNIVFQLGGFGTDNRAGLPKQLHRISAIRNREHVIIGLTMRVGRHVSGIAHIIADLLFGSTNDTVASPPSILFMGEPGSGKTTVVREVTRLLAERSNVCIVDTSNEIAGDGDVPHPCVGYARRMMVPTLDQQSAVMIECVQNHTPMVMVIDEIGRSTEVEAARTCKNRGVRLIASAHGDLRKLVKNPKLRGLIGGVESVTLGDIQAKIEAKRHNNATGMSKTKSERSGPPTFDMIVELSRDERHSWRIITDTADAVDRILDGQRYRVQRRTRDPTTGAVQIAFENS